MSEAKFTPGPWIVDSKWPAHRSHHCISAAVGQPREHRAMAQVVTNIDGEPYSEGMANARLISAAPDLYEALENAVFQIEYPHDKFKETGTGNHALTAARAALAKARGEQP